VEKLDLRKQLKHLYQPSARQIAEVQVPAFTFLMVDGQGDPNTSTSYAEAVEALFSVSYTAKFMVKKGPAPQDYAVMPLEGLWWADDLAAFARGERALWRWTMMIMQPQCVPPALLEKAMAEAVRKKPLPGIARLRIEQFEEGPCGSRVSSEPASRSRPVHFCSSAATGRAGRSCAALHRPVTVANAR
jgi:hypothetical protein